MPFSPLVFHYSSCFPHLLPPRLSVTVADKKADGDDKHGFVGQFSVPLSDIPQDKPVIFWYDLCGAAIGYMRIKADYDPEFHRLNLTIRECKGIPPSAGRQDANPYVKVYLVPDKAKTTKRKTKVHKGTTSPVFNETYLYDLKDEEDKNKVFELSLWNFYGGVSKNDMVGIVYIPVKDIFEENHISQWFPLQRPVKGAVHDD